MRIHHFVLLFTILFASEPVLAQSKQGYIKAGNTCLEEGDAFCAVAHYRSALDYGEDAAVHLFLARGNMMLHDYREAQAHAQQVIALQSTGPATTEATLIAADCARRLGQFDKAKYLTEQTMAADSASVVILSPFKSALEKAELRSRDTLPLRVTPLGGDVNSPQSDFAPVLLGDSVLYYSSLRYMAPGSKPESSTSRITRFSLAGSAEKSSPLPASINQVSFNNANASVSPDGKWMVFTRCLKDENNRLQCNLYASNNRNGKWTDAFRLPATINAAGSTTTQPCIVTSGAEGYRLFFSSDRPGGSGGMDIWTCAFNGDKYSDLKNAGTLVNGSTDEFSPFLDLLNDTLYFSSERPEGLGGLDLYAIPWPVRDSPAKLLSPPLNSGYNDLYLTRGYGTTQRQLLVSNRPPAKSLQGSACCYDIFAVERIELSKKDSAAWASNARNAFDSPEAFGRLNMDDKLKTINSAFPIRLYFDNDYPDPRSRKPSTSTQVDALARDYMGRERDYLERQENEEAAETIRTFFLDSVGGYLDRLDRFSDQLVQVLESDTGKILIRITGTASPLAETRYNLILSERRINSLLNYWKAWGGGELRTHLDSGRLQIDFDPSGESRSAGNVSDDYADVSKSVYSLGACLERRIEVIRIEQLP